MLGETSMAMVACNECAGQVSTKAKSCPHCGAPFEAFIGPAKGFKDFFSVERSEQRLSNARETKAKAGRGLFRAVLWIVAILAVLLIVVSL